MSLLSLDGTVLAVNESLLGLLGHGEDEVVGTPAWRWCHPEDAERCRSALAAVSAGLWPSPVRSLWRAVLADGSVAELERSLSLVVVGGERYVLVTVTRSLRSMD